MPTGGYLRSLFEKKEREMNGQANQNPRHQSNAERVRIRPNIRPDAPDVAQFRALVTTLLDGPSYVIVRRTKSDYKRLADFAKVLHIRIDRQDQTRSWGVYSSTHLPGCLLYKATWEKGPISLARLTHEQRRKMVSSIAQYMTTPRCNHLNTVLQTLDNVLSHDLALGLRPTDQNVNWNGISVFRAFKYGSIALRWNFLVRNENLEEALLSTVNAIEEVLIEEREAKIVSVDAIEMTFDSPNFIVDRIGELIRVPNTQS